MRCRMTDDESSGTDIDLPAQSVFQATLKPARFKRSVLPSGIGRANPGHCAAAVAAGKTPKRATF